MATADKSNLFSNLFRDIGKPGGSIAPTTMLAIAILALLGWRLLPTLTNRQTTFTT
jgi:hypothetical protein